MNNFLLLAIIFISAAIGFFVGCWLDSIRWDKMIRKMMDINGKQLEELMRYREMKLPSDWKRIR